MPKPDGLRGRTLSPRALDRAAEARWPWLFWMGFSTVRGWLYYGLTLNVLALLSMVVDLDPATPGLVIGGTGAFVWAIQLERRREADHRE